MLNEIIQYLTQYPEGKILFDTPVTVKKSPHDLVCMINGVWGSVDKGLWLLDGNSQWYLITAIDQNAELVLNSIYQRISLMKYDQSRVPFYSEAYGEAI
jgi:hypothetical protein